MRYLGLFLFPLVLVPVLHAFLSPRSLQQHPARSGRLCNSQQMTLWMADPAAIHEATSTIATSIAVPVSSSLLQLPPTVLRSIELGGFPALGMFLATQLGLQVPTPPNVLGALQHFAAGILLTTVAKELLPEMVNAQGLYENLASGIGFFSGVGLLIVLGILLPEEEGEDEHSSSNHAPVNSDSSQPTVTTTNIVPQLPSLRNRKVSRKAGAVARSSSIRSLSTDETASVQQDRTTGPSIDTEAAQEVSTAEILNKYALLPAALLAAVSIDSALDGLLIGTSTALDPSTGTILSASLAVESSFLGLTIGTALQSCRQGLVGSSFAPLALLVGALAGGSLAPILAESPVLLAGILGFGTSATLFMVAEELLLESHENGAEHVWWVDFQLYTGFFASVMVDKLI